MKDSCVTYTLYEEDLPAIEDWLVSNHISPLVFDVSDLDIQITVVPKIVLSIQFDNQQDYTLFNLTWADRL